MENCGPLCRRSIKEGRFSDIKYVGVDETSQRKGHDYITVFADINTGRIIFITKGKDASTLASLQCVKRPQWNSKTDQRCLL